MGRAVPSLRMPTRPPARAARQNCIVPIKAEALPAWAAWRDRAPTAELGMSHAHAAERDHDWQHDAVHAATCKTAQTNTARGQNVADDRAAQDPAEPNRQQESG